MYPEPAPVLRRSPGMTLLWGSGIVLYLLLTLIVLAVGGYALMLHAGVRLAAEGDYAPLDNSAGIPPAVSPYFERVTPRFNAAGFTTVLDLRQTHARTINTAYLRIFENREDRALGVAFCPVDIEGDQTVLLSSLCQFSQYFGGRLEITSSNFAESDPFAAFEHRRVMNFPGVEDPVELYAAHRAFVRRIGPESPPRFYEPGKALDFVREALRTEIQDQVDAGYLELDRGEGAYRLTWKGAFMVTGRTLWPAGALRRAREAATSSRFLEEESIAAGAPAR